MIECDVRKTPQDLYNPWNGDFNAQMKRAHDLQVAPEEEVAFWLGDSTTQCQDRDSGPGRELASDWIELARCT
eukprot:scaffold24512_cov54-Phaeocystis_antarctica.AAC.2